MSILSDLIGNRKIINRKTDILVKIPLGIILFVVIAFLPFIVAFGGMWITKLLTGQECLNEGNCFWAAIPWLCFLTFPCGGGLLLVFLIKSFKQSWRLYNQ
jgi:hypothetical protein